MTKAAAEPLRRSLGRRACGRRSMSRACCSTARNLLGSDLRITNFGGGNTSAKVTMTDPLTGEPVEVLWVKGSGGDLGSMKLDGFATLYWTSSKR